MAFGSLWLPVVVSAVVVWFLSALLHMALKYHRADYRQLPDEAAVAAGLGKNLPPPGLYAMPYCVDSAAMKDPAMVEKFTRGPVALVAVMKSGPPKMGRHLALWLAFCLLVSFTAAYLARNTLAPGAAALAVARITGTVAFVGYGYGAFQDSIWHGIPWANSVRGLIDAAIYAVATALLFVWLWPGA